MENASTTEGLVDGLSFAASEQSTSVEATPVSSIEDQQGRFGADCSTP
eukprot:CAMPEP_0183406986 /NCGR_PEP_ID=MMETSP0370-20130417/17030_1 /TAXON_ID=268820 /ORGANISM="Peridinium aciculiferum, Strain PAER-2" /LENGTH=47 /DNA_ID= /DNA_START= /DNA_END= /DNA_ORIENTATION=